MTCLLRFLFLVALTIQGPFVVHAFVLPSRTAYASPSSTLTRKAQEDAAASFVLMAKKGAKTTSTKGGGGGGLISSSRRKQLGISDDEEEYDLDVALGANTDPLISKIIAGSLIVTLLALLVAGVVIPSLTDYGDGVCSPIQNGGRC